MVFREVSLIPSTVCAEILYLLQLLAETSMAMKATLSRCLFLSKSKAPLFFLRSSAPSPPCFFPSKRFYPFFPSSPTFCTSSENPEPNKPNPKLVNFSLPSDSDSDSEAPTKQVGKPKLPPPYNPFNNKPIVEEPEDPKNLQEVFAKIREDGLMNSAVKMFDGLSQDGLTHEALELFSQIKDKGTMPDVIAHTAVMEAYVKAGQAKDAQKVFLRMLASGVLPNAYSYRVVIRGLAESGEVRMVREAKKYLGEMVARGMRPNAATCVAVVEGLVGVGCEEEGREVVAMLKEKGAAPPEEMIRDAVKDKRGLVYSIMISALNESI